MKVYEVLFKSCAITFIENGINKGFCLNKGDFIFIEPNCIQHIVDNKWVKSNLLTKIVYKKLTSLEEDFEWCEIDDINIVNPIIDYSSYVNFESVLNFNNFKLLVDRGVLLDVTNQWNREEKLKSILNDSI